MTTFNSHLSKNKKNHHKKRKSQDDASSWDIIVLTFRLLFQRIHFWIQPNFWAVIFSLGLITAPAARAALFYTVKAGLCDPGGSSVRAIIKMKNGFKIFFWKAMLLDLIRWGIFIIVSVSIYFWVSRDTWVLRSVSIISFYGFVLWWISNGYIFPIMVDNPNESPLQIIKEALSLGFTKPFQSLLYAVVTALLSILGTVLLGPILLIIPVARALLMMQGYWFVTGAVIPGFLNIYDYVSRYKTEDSFE